MQREVSSYKKRESKTLMVLVLLVVTSLIMLNLKITRVTFYSIIPFPDEGIPIPVVENGQEVQHELVKYSNSSGIIIATNPQVTCYWKPLEVDDGWKDCVSTFEITDLRQQQQILNNPLVNVLFNNADIKNIKVRYSDSYDIQRVFQTETTKKKEIIMNPQGNSYSANEIVKTRFVNEESELTVREFTDFKESDIIVNTKRPFAIEVKYQAPKYASNSFNVSIFDTDFNASIDPDQTECGTLNTSGTYLLTQNVSANQNCMTLTANNIELNCQGNAIIYGIDGNGGQGISFSSINNTIIRNCFIIDGMGELQDAGYSVFITAAHNTTFVNNTIIKRGEGGYGLVFDGSRNNFIKNNTIVNNGRNVNSVYIQSTSFDTLIEGNTINSTCMDIEEIYVDSASQNTTIYNNTILKQNQGGTGITMDTAEGMTIAYNQINAYAPETTGIFLSNVNAGLNKLENNVVNVYSESGYGGYLSTSSGLQIKNNTFLIQNNYSIAFYATLQSINNVFNNNTINATGSQIFGIYIDQDSTNNVVHNNTLSIQGNESIGIYIEDSGYEDIAFNFVWSNGSRVANIDLSNTPGTTITSNRLYVDGASSSAIKIEDSSNQNIISNNSMYIRGSMSAGGVVESGTENKITNSTIIVESEQGRGISFEGSSSLTVIDALKINIQGTQSSGIYILEGDHNFTAKNIRVYKGANTFDIFINTLVSGGTWNFTNTTVEEINWLSAANALLVASYFIDIETTFNNNPFSNATVRITNSSLTNVTLTTTDSNGKSVFLLKGFEQRTNIDSASYSYTLYVTSSGQEFIENYELDDNKFFQFNFGSSSSSGSSSGSGARLGGGQRSTPVPVQPSQEKSPISLSPPTKVEDTLFDIKLELPMKILKDTQALLASIELANLRKLITGESSKKVNITVEYRIVNNDTGEQVYREEEIIPVETQNEFLKSIDISRLKAGKYSFLVNMSYVGQVAPAIAQENFQVEHNSKDIVIKAAIILIAVTLAITGRIFFSRNTVKLSAMEETQIQQEQKKDTTTSL